MTYTRGCALKRAIASVGWPDWSAPFSSLPGTRQVVIGEVDRVQTSCGSRDGVVGGSESLGFVMAGQTQGDELRDPLFSLEALDDRLKAAAGREKL